jgi:hypothetical protein
MPLRCVTFTMVPLAESIVQSWESAIARPKFSAAGFSEFDSWFGFELAQRNEEDSEF